MVIPSRNRSAMEDPPSRLARVLTQQRSFRGQTTEKGEYALSALPKQKKDTIGEHDRKSAVPIAEAIDVHGASLGVCESLKGQH